MSETGVPTTEQLTESVLSRCKTPFNAPRLMVFALVVCNISVRKHPSFRACRRTVIGSTRRTRPICLTEIDGLVSAETCKQPGCFSRTISSVSAEDVRGNVSDFCRVFPHG